MKKILGLDLGTTSIGWAIVEAVDEKKENVITGEKSKTDINNDRVGIYQDAVGVRIIPADEMQRRFNEGKKLNDGEKHTPTADRRIKRSSRRTSSRYKLRRDKLLAVLEYLKLKPAGSFVKNDKGGWIDDRTNGKWYSKEKKYSINNKGQQIHKRQPDDEGDTDIGKQLYKLRDRAIREKIELEDLGRILLLLNQWRGYSSDRFTINEKSTFDYFTGTVINLNETPVDTVYEDNAKTKLKYNQYEVTVQFTDPIKDENDNFISKISGYHFCQKLKFKVGEIITFKFEKKETKVKKVVINQYFKINLVNPNPDDWNFKYQNLNKTLTEWCNEEGTVGSYFYQNFYIEKNIDRIRTNVVNRNWYENELKKIFKKQYAEHREYFQQFDIDSILEVAFKDKNTHLRVKNILPEEDEDLLEAQLRCLISECIIYFQRPWQQAKDKGACRFEKIKVWKERVKKGTKEKEKFQTYEGRTVVPRSHPLHQEFKIWQQINNVRLFYIKDGKTTNLFDDINSDLLKQFVGKDIIEIKSLLYKELQQKKSLSWISFVEKTLNISVFVEGLKTKIKNQENPIEYFTVNYIKRTKKGDLQENLLKGNNTKACLKSVLKDKPDEWFDEIVKEGKDDHKNKEVVEKYSYKTCEYAVNNLQLLWELIYDITESKSDKVALNIKKHFPDFSNETCSILSKINFDDNGMAQLSAKAIRRLLPLMKVYKQGEAVLYPQKVKERINALLEQNQNDSNNEIPEEERLESLREFITDVNARKRLSKFDDEKQFTGLNYWEAAAIVYGQHAKHGEQSENIKKDIDKLFEPVKRNSVNNPVVEKIVNETISLCKEIYQRYGFDEVRIELSRELKSSREEREQMWEGMTKNAARTEWAKTMLRELMNDDYHKEHSNLDALNKNNIDKIKIIEDVVKFQTGKLYEEKTKEYKLNEPTKAEIMKYLIWLEQNFKCPYTNQFIPLTDVFSKNKRVEIEHIIPKERYFDNSYGNKVITWTEVNADKANNGNRTAFEYIVSKRSTSDKISLASGKTVTLVSADKWEEHIKSMFPKGRKQLNLLRKSIPDDPISRQLKETQYISVLVKERLGKVIGIDKVWSTSGAITDMLRQSWHLNDVMKELMRNRFELFNGAGLKDNFPNLIISEEVDKETGEIIPEKFLGYSKRLDYRHHALDAIIIACTKQQHIQYINALNAQYTANIDNDESQKIKYNKLRYSLCVGDKRTTFKTPWNENDFIPKTKEVMKNLIISHKNVRLLISPTKHGKSQKDNTSKIASIRGELHLETNYAKRNYFEAGTQLSLDKIIETIINLKFENQNQSIVFPKIFETIIKEVVLKEKYQKVLLSYFTEYENVRITDKKVKTTIASNNNLSIKELRQLILEKISNDEVLSKIDKLSIYNLKQRSSARPMGLSMNLNDLDVISKIADPRLKRLAIIRLTYISNKLKTIKEDKSIEKEEKDKLIKHLQQLPLYTNAIYEVKIKNEETTEWIFLPNINIEQIEKIDYGRKVKSEQIKRLVTERLRKYNNNPQEAFANIIEMPLFVAKNKIEVKKVRQKSYFQDLYEIKPKKFVYSSGMFQLYIFEHKKDKSIKRESKFLKFIDAVKLIDFNKPEKIIYSEFIAHDNNTDYDLAFTLQGNDLIYLPNEDESIESINFNDISEISDRLYIIKEINPSLKNIALQKHTSADSISLNKGDIDMISLSIEAEEINEIIKISSTSFIQNCIKVYTDKLGKKIVPYWAFKYGCWNKDDAKTNGLL